MFLVPISIPIVAALLFVLWDAFKPLPNAGPIDQFAIEHFVTPCSKTLDCRNRVGLIPQILPLGGSRPAMDELFRQAGYDDSLAGWYGHLDEFDAIYSKGGFGSFWCSPTIVVGLSFDEQERLAGAEMWRRMSCL
ncbi:hypothetical protein GGR20_001913 [Devosia subaequoris]|uniref:Uncharacterized protein n=1 Tax=Devosia subaequoris TaxID=395930 RepID=A0A7W6INI6_9HYPH|nr:hypothetical protein [Devosia subaequoris]MBB4052270.1 hypothetical protein [Devosia subaequoris]MCP1209433.1 hypothetical protein [Devosia subaequoris]